MTNTVTVTPIQAGRKLLPFLAEIVKDLGDGKTLVLNLEELKEMIVFTKDIVKN